MRLIDGDQRVTIFGNDEHGDSEMRSMTILDIVKDATRDEIQDVPAIPVYMVKRMRDAQRRYFRTRDNGALQESKMCEKEIDKLIADNGAVQSRLF